MRQEAEHGIFKPVLGALGVASLFLTIVGNLVFSPKSSLTPTRPIASTERALQAERAPQFEPAPVAEVPADLAPQTDETIVARPVELQNSPHESASDIAAVEQVPTAEQAPKSDETIIALPVLGPTLPTATAGEVLVVEQAPQAEQPPLPEQSQNTDSAVAVVPVGPVISLPETAIANSVPDVRPESEITSQDDDVQQQPTVAAGEPPRPVVLQPLSHHERKLLRKAEHAEKKKNRLLAHGRPIVGR